MTADRPLLGIVLMLGFCVLAPLGDSIAKLLGGSMSLGMLVIIRFAIQVIILLPIVLLTGGTLRMERRLFRLTALRTVFHILGISGMFMALRFLPLADAVAIAFVMPFIMLILGKTILGEEVGPYRLGACAVGFIGTLLVIQPNFIAVGAAALLPLMVAFVFSFFMLVTRQIAKDVDPIAMQTVSGLMACAVIVPLLLVGNALGWAEAALTVPVGGDILLVIALGTLGTFAHLLMTWSLRFAPSATLAPMQYLEIPIATFVGWLIFKDLPNGLAAVGILITIAAGLYVIFREQRNAAALR